MHGYLVKVVLYEKENVPSTMRPDCWPVEDRYFYHLSINGRLTDTVKKSIVETPALAEMLLEHWSTLLESRGYGKFTAQVESVYLGKHETRWMKKNTEAVKEKLLSASNQE